MEVLRERPPCQLRVVETRSSVGSTAHVCTHVHVSRFRLVVGAPTANWLANASVVNPGAIYRCKIGKNPDLNCEQLQLGELGVGPGVCVWGGGVGCPSICPGKTHSLK